MKKIYENAIVFGSNGLVGSSVSARLSKSSMITNLIQSSRSDVDLLNFNETKQYINSIKPSLVIVAAAKVGGIHANNTYRSQFLIENIRINMNILESLFNFPNCKIINLGSSCIYPLDSKNPIVEESIFTGKLEPTNSPYAIAKLAAIELANSMKVQYGHEIINLMPTNLYGPNDNFSKKESHVIPGMIRRMHSAKVNNLSEFSIWGSGLPKREFLYVDDLASAIEFLLENTTNEELLNVGSGQEVQILELANLMKNIIGFTGELVFDTSMPDGNPRKLIDSTKINRLGWKPKISLEEGLSLTYKWFNNNYDSIRK